MSRIGKSPIQIPDKTTVELDGQLVVAKGPKGEMSYTLNSNLKAEKKDNQLTIAIANPKKKYINALWGTNRQRVANIIDGVSHGFKKQLEINGVGYKADLQGKKLVLNVGYSQPVEFEVPEQVEAKVEKNIITLESADKELLGETAAQIKHIRKPEPYKGKGIKYVGEQIIRKAGKQVKTGGE